LKVSTIKFYNIPSFIIGNMEFEEVVEEISGIVDVPREEIEKKLREFLDYGVPMEQARNALIRKYGGGTREKKIKDIKPNERNIITIGKILAVDEREVVVKGKARKIYRGLIGDETGIIPFTAWKDFDLHKGDVVKITRASASEWQGQPRLSLSEWTEVQKIEKEIELVKMPPRKLNLIDLRPNLSNVEVRGKISSIEKREANVGDEKKEVYSGIIEDETARVRFTAWKNFEINEGDAVRIKGAYVRSWRGSPQIIFDENAEIEKLDEKIEYKPYVIPLYKIVERGGGLDIMAEGVILGIRRNSGIIFRCPYCNRRLREGVCDEHGQVDGIPDLRIRAVVDDGTGAVDVIFNREISEKLLGKKMDDYLKMAEETMDYGIVYSDIVDKLLAMPVRIYGDSIQSDFIISIIAKDGKRIEPDVKGEAEEILMEVGG